MAHFLKCVRNYEQNFNFTFFKNFFWLRKNMMATKNHVAGHIWPAGREFDMPDLRCHFKDDIINDILFLNSNI